MTSQQMIEEIDRLARLCEAKNAEIEPLRSEVAKLRDAGKRLLERMSGSGWAVAKPIRHSETEYIALIRLFTEPDVNSSALTYEQEVGAKALEKLRPINWTKEMSDAWHQNLPDVRAAFDALIRAASKGEVK